MESVLYSFVVLCFLGISVTNGDIATKCVSDCRGVRNGDYQDCKSCEVFVTCLHNRIIIRPCPPHLVWDDVKKNCVAQSTTCKKLTDIATKCVSDCRGVRDGDYQDCKSCAVFVTCSNNQMFVRPCPSRLVWDDVKKNCEAQSSTCKRINDFGQMPDDVMAGSMMEDIRRVNVPRPRHCNSTGTTCVSDCTGKKDGDYQSCHGCDVYVSCVAGLRYDDRPCAPGGLVWDDKKKRCEWTSPTCKGCYTPNIPCRGTGPRCVSQCTSLPDGDYQSCLGCDVYLSCSNKLKYDKRPCAPGGTVWDDNKKICDWWSNTCHRC